MSKKSIQLFIFAIMAITVLVVIVFVFNRRALTQPVVKINGHIWNVEVVLTPEAIKQGLSGRESLPFNTGMLFTFNPSAAHSFWMKNMHFPLDLVWVNAGRVVRLDENLPPEGALPVNVYPSYSAVTHVLEINAGEAKKYNLKIGDEVFIK